MYQLMIVDPYDSSAEFSADGEGFATIGDAVQSLANAGDWAFRIYNEDGACVLHGAICAPSGGAGFTFDKVRRRPPLGGAEDVPQ